jgi:hypothetical protein
MVQYVSWGGQTNLKQGQLSLAQQYADAGMFARARAAFIKAGGTWNNAVHKQLKQEAADTTRYGGDIALKWSDYGVRTQEQLNEIIEWAKQGKFNLIANKINSLGGAKKFNDGGNRLQKKLAAEYLGFQPDTDLNKKGVQPGAGTTEFKRVEPDVDPVFEPNVTTQNEDGTTTTLDTTTTGGQETPWRSQFVAPITEGQKGSWDVGQARTDAQKWRNLHMDANMNKYGLKRVGTNAIQRSTDISDADWDSFTKKRNEIDSRFKKMIGWKPK